MHDVNGLAGRVPVWTIIKLNISFSYMYKEFSPAPTHTWCEWVGRVPVWTIIKLNISFHIYVQRGIRKGIFAAAFVSVVGGGGGCGVIGSGVK